MHANSLARHSAVLLRTYTNFCFIADGMVMRAVCAFSLYFACVPNNARAGINNNKVYVWYCIMKRERERER
jgi:hypothetical protein